MTLGLSLYVDSVKSLDTYAVSHCPENEVKAHEASGQAQTTPATRGSGQKSRLNSHDQDDVYLKMYLKGKELPALLTRLGL